MIAVRLSKIVMTGGIALWAFIVTLNNITDYDSNWTYVHHVLAMDTVFPDSTLTSRAITDPALQTAAYWIIIAIEGLTCLAFVVATYLMLTKLSAPKAAFQKAKNFTAVGVLLGFGLWFIGFMGIAGGWFVMWQSKIWNAQDDSFKFYMTILAVGIYVFLDSDGESDSPS